MNRFVALIAMGVLLSPFVVHAQIITPGTGDYLRSIGFTDEHFAREMSTEDREPFAIAEGEGRISDPVGDVVNRVGGVSELGEGWFDLTQATLEKDSENAEWVFRMEVAEPFPHKTSLNGNFFAYIDTDGDAFDNQDQGIGVGADGEFKVKISKTEGGWTQEFRYYNPAINARTWGRDRESAMTFEVERQAIVMRIPFDEIASDATPRWRAVAAGALSFSNEDTAVDVIPGVGYPPPKGETYPEPSGGSKSTYVIGLIILVLLAAGVWRVRRGVVKE